MCIRDRCTVLSPKVTSTNALTKQLTRLQLRFPDTRSYGNRMLMLLCVYEEKKDNNSMNYLKIPEVRIVNTHDVDDSDTPGKEQAATEHKVPSLLLVPPCSAPRRRHSWICG